MKTALVATVSAPALTLPGTALAQDAIRIGVLVAFRGAFTAGGADGERNLEMAIAERGGTIAARPIEVVIAPTDTTPFPAIRRALERIAQDGVDFMIGPLSGSEGIAIRDVAKTYPGITFINGISGALEMTWVDPAPDVFRCNLGGVQRGQGLGQRVVNAHGSTRVATIAADYSLGYSDVMGFAVDFCRAGGEIAERFWVPLGSADSGGVIAAQR